MDRLIDEIALDLGRGLSRRKALTRFLTAIGGAFAASLGLPRLSQGASCYAACEAKCTDANGVLDFTCFRNCVNSDPNNCGRCGNQCASGQICSNGQCVTPSSCASDFPTSASITAAQAAIAGGALQAALSPQGCYQYQVTMSGGVKTSERFIYNGNTVLSFQHTGNTSTGIQDDNGDGVPEWRTDATRGAVATQNQLVTSKYDTDGSPVERRTYTYPTGTLHVVYEETNDSSGLQPRGQYDAQPYEAAQESPSTPVSAAAVTCSASQCDPNNLRNLLNQAFDQGLQCLYNNNARGLANRIIAAFYENPINIQCASIPPVNGFQVRAHTIQPFPYPLDLNPHATIEVNQDFFCSLSPAEQLSTLFHEVMHLLIPEHDPNKEAAAASGDHGADQLYACEDLCFQPHASTTQCACATCLETTKCDQRCATSLGFQTCSDDFGAWCPCLARLRWYPSCTACLSGCSSSLACFGFSFCVPANRHRCSPVTCP
jgi:hypothetical protein